MAGLVGLPGLANADDDDRRRASPGALQWRLGEARVRYGHEILFRYPGERRWRQAPGEALDVADGWVIGTDRRNGGFGIYRWNGRGWQRMPGAGVDIGGAWDRPWVINDRGERFVWSGYGWREDGRSRGRERDRGDNRNGVHREFGSVWRNQR